MADRPKPRLLPLLLLAAGLTLLVTGVRLLGELDGWDERWFSRDAGSPLNPFGIIWLVPVFGFLFGRRLAQGGHRPGSSVGLFAPLVGAAVLLGVAMYVGSRYEGTQLRDAGRWLPYVGGGLALLGLFSWPRAFVANLGYGLMARLPVVVVQYFDIQRGWQTHYGKVHPKLPTMTADERIAALTLAQAGFWLPLTILVGGVFAALGAATVRR